MSQLSAEVAPETPAAPPARADRRRRGVVRTIVEADLVVLVLVAAGFGGGWLWHRWWAPAPSGVVGVPVEGSQVPQWFPDPYEAGERAMFAATAEFALVALGLGLLVGLLAALLARRTPLVTLVAVLVGSAAAAYVMYRFGTSLAPPDPDPIARTLQPGDPLVGTIEIAGWTPYLSWPIGALAGFGLGCLVGHGVTQVRSHDGDPAWLPASPKAPPPGPPPPG